VCQVENIEMKDGKPTWLHHCEQCLACLQWCPQEAIQVGRKTEGRKRYHHPEITASDLM
jgi:MinD superfamily P-loop ATPase